MAADNICKNRMRLHLKRAFVILNKNQEQTMHDVNVSQDRMLQTVREIFQGKPKKLPLQRALYTIYVHHAIAEGRRQADQGQAIPHEKVMEAMWKQFKS